MRNAAENSESSTRIELQTFPYLSITKERPNEFQYLQLKKYCNAKSSDILKERIFIKAESSKETSPIHTFIPQH